jgi:hypothetical protein
MAIFLPQLRTGNVAASQGAYAPTDSDVVAWVNAGGSTSSPGLAALQTFAVGVKSLFGISTLNQKFDRLFVHAGMGTRASSRLCLATRNSLTEVSTPTWSSFGPGYQGDGVSAALNWGWAPAAGPNSGTNNMCIGGVMLAVTGGTLFGNQTAGTNNTVIGPVDASHMSFAVNDASALNDSIAVTRQGGRWHAERTAAGASGAALYYNGVSKGTSSHGSAAVSAQNMYGLAYNNAGTIQGYSSDTIGAQYAGSAITSTNMAAWDALVAALMHGLDPTDY